MSRVVILQSNYIPWRGYFDLIHDADIFVWYDEVQYTREDWRNRNLIYSKQGLHWLSIPIPRKFCRAKISEAIIEDNYWQEQHYQSLRHAYARAPFYSDLLPWLDALLMRTSWDRLIDVNRYFIESLAKQLKISTRFVDSSEIIGGGDRISRLVRIVADLGGREYLSGPAAKNYLRGSEHLFEESGIEVIYKDYSGYPPYPQLRRPYQSNVSIVDMIANVGFDSLPSLIWEWREPFLNLPVGSLRDRSF